MRVNYDDNLFTSRAVVETVARERGYLPYAAGDRATVLGVDDRLDKNPSWFRDAIKAPGWVIPKCAVMPDHPQFGTVPLRAAPPGLAGHAQVVRPRPRRDAPLPPRRPQAPAAEGR